MQSRPVADPEMVKRIYSSVHNHELRSLLLKIVSDQRITKRSRVSSRRRTKAQVHQYINESYSHLTC